MNFPRIRRGLEDLLEFLPPSEAGRLRDEPAGDRWHRHVDGTGGDLLRVRAGLGPPIVVVNSHNMAFYVWEEAVRRGLVGAGTHAVHVDDHPDFFEPDQVMPADEGPEQSLRLARALRWNDWIAAAFARGVVDRLTDVSRGDLQGHRPPFVAVPTPEGTRYLEAGQARGEPHPWMLRLDVPVRGRYRLARSDGLAPGTVVFADPTPREPPRDTDQALAMLPAVAREGRRVDSRPEDGGEVSVPLEAGSVWLLALAPGDERGMPPPLSARFDVAGTEAETGVRLRRLRRDVTTLAALVETPAPPGPAGTILDVDLDCLNVHRETGRPDAETIDATRVRALVRNLRRAVPDPGIVTVALSPDCLAPRVAAEDLAEMGLEGVRPPPGHLGMAEGRRRLALFLRAWREREQESRA